jgi:DNA-binding MarR family transcriptional regulator
MARTRETAAMVLELRQCLCLNLRMAARVVSAAYDDAMRPLGLRITQFSLLGGIAALQPVPLTRLADALALDKTTLPRSLRPLERGGLVVVEPGPDRRTRLARLTPRGERALAAAFGEWRKVQERFGRRLKAQGLPAALGQLRRLRAAARG